MRRVFPERPLDRRSASEAMEQSAPIRSRPTGRAKSDRALCQTGPMDRLALTRQIRFGLAELSTRQYRSSFCLTELLSTSYANNHCR
jgi:hypothetical protein